MKKEVFIVQQLFPSLETEYSFTFSLCFIFAFNCRIWQNVLETRKILFYEGTPMLNLQETEAELHSQLYYKAHSWNLNIMRAEKSRYVLYFEEMIWRQYYLLFYQKRKKCIFVNVDWFLLKLGNECLYCSLKESHIHCNIRFCKLQPAT